MGAPSKTPGRPRVCRSICSSRRKLPVPCVGFLLHVRPPRLRFVNCCVRNPICRPAKERKKAKIVKEKSRKPPQPIVDFTDYSLPKRKCAGNAKNAGTRIRDCALRKLLLQRKAANRLKNSKLFIGPTPSRLGRAGPSCLRKCGVPGSSLA